MTPRAKQLAAVRRLLKKDGCGPKHIANCLKYESRVLDLQDEGLSRGDAQGVAEAEGLSTLNENPFE